MANNININIPINDLVAEIVAKLQPLLEGLNNPAPQQAEKYLTRKETAALLNISLPTLTHYTKHGIIIGNRIGARVLYKRSEITNALQQIRGGRNA